MFTKSDCKLCNRLKANYDLSGVDIQEIDGENAEGLSLLAYYGLIEIARKQLPILVIDDRPDSIFLGKTKVIEFDDICKCLKPLDCVGIKDEKYAVGKYDSCLTGVCHI